MNLINLTTDEYPSSLYQVRQANPNVSFPAEPSDEDLAPFGYANVQPTPQPSHDQRTERIEEATPESDIEGVYHQKWAVRDATAQEIADYDISHLPPPDWKGFATEAMVNPEVNSLLSSMLAQSPGLYAGVTVGLGQASQGDPTMFTSSWALLMSTNLVSPSTLGTLQTLFTEYNISLGEV